MERLVVDAADVVEEERSVAALTKLEAEPALNVLTGGWFAEAGAAAPGAPNHQNRECTLALT